MSRKTRSARGGAALLALMSLLFACSRSSQKRFSFEEGTSFQLLDAAKTRSELGRRDAFIAGLTPLDRQLRMKSPKPVSEAAFLAFAQSQAKSFKPEQSRRVVESLTRLQTQFTALRLTPLLPANIAIGLTTGEEEGAGGFDLTYTRHGVIFLNDKAVARKDLDLALAHELFHVITYRAPDLKNALYSALGFERTEKVRWPSALEAERLTSPEAPAAEHVLVLRPSNGPPRRVVFAWASNADYRGGGFNEYATPLWSVLDGEGTPGPFVTSETIPGLKSALSRNTLFLGGPEEILADNFGLLLTHPEGADDPKFLSTLQAILQRHAVMADKDVAPEAF